MRRLQVIAALLLWWCASAPLLAQERIVSYDSIVTINADASLDVVEHIRVRAEGNNIRRGIYRDFPTRYPDRLGNRVNVDLEVLGVERDGKPEPWFAERMRNGVRINTGNDDFLPTPAEFTYTLRYRTTRQLGFFDAHDELYWNAIGTGWMFAIERGTVEVRLPQPVPESALSAEGYTGAQGASGQHGYVAELSAPGVARWRLTTPLAPREGLTVVLSFPKGVVAGPSRLQRTAWLFKDNLAGLIALAGLLVLLVYCIGRWHRVGRDPRPGPIVVEYDPPDGLAPSALRYIERMRHDTTAFSADVLSLAVAGYLAIDRDKSLLKDRWRLDRARGVAQRPTQGSEQDALLDSLFAKGDSIELDNRNAARMQAAIGAHGKVLASRYKGRMFHVNGGSMFMAFLIAFAFSTAAFIAFASTGSGVALALPLILAMFGVAVGFSFLIPAPTPEGRRMRDRIEGLRRYLSVADKQDLQQLQGPGTAEPTLDAGRFEFLLPYAVALGVEEAWTKKFTLAVGAAAAAAATGAIAWYHGPGGTRGITDIAGFSRAVGSSLSSQIASASSPPGSSSGSGGGGFSGGGGGGGGGGGR